MNKLKTIYDIDESNQATPTHQTKLKHICVKNALTQFYAKTIQCFALEKKLAQEPIQTIEAEPIEAETIEAGPIAALSVNNTLLDTELVATINQRLKENRDLKRNEKNLNQAASNESVLVEKVVKRNYNKKRTVENISKKVLRPRNKK